MKFIKLFEQFNSETELKINNLLDKINKSGIESLTPEEKKILDTINISDEDVYDEDEYDEDDSLDNDNFINIEIECTLPKLRDYSIQFISSHIENSNSGDSNKLIYGELIITPKGQSSEIYLTGFIEVDGKSNYYGYQFCFDEFNDGDEDCEYFDNMVENDDILNSYIEEFFKEVVLQVKAEL